MKKLFLFFILLSCSLLGMAQEQYIKISGTVRNAQTDEILPDANIDVPGTNIGTITNEDGYFTLKVAKKPSHILVTSIGYKNKKVSLDKNVEDLKIELTPTTVILQELIVYSSKAKELLLAALDKRKVNNKQDKEMQTSFYRETVQKGSRFIDISEAVLNTYREPYEYGIDNDKVKIVQGRHLISQRGKDSLAVKVMGGPTLPITLDAVKNDEVIFDPIDRDCYLYEMDDPAVIDDQPQLVIRFSPIDVKPWALYRGKIYLNERTLAFTRVEFSLDMKDQAKAIKHMLYKKPAGLRFKPRELTTIIDYKNGRIHYMKNTFRFHCDWKKRLFARNYTCTSEMVITDVEENYKGPKIAYKDKFGERDTFRDAVQYFSDPDFWGNYNIIEPTVSLEKAVDRLKKTH